MFEMHIWLTLRDTYENEDIIETKECDYDEIFYMLSMHDIEVKKQNGNVFLEKTVFSNRKTREIDGILNAIKRIAEIASGSYGLIYIWDDEDKYEKENEFQVYVIAKGRVFLRKDEFLSPCIPVIENK